jgi:hypothetical protein
MEQESPTKARVARVEISERLWEMIEEVAVIMRATPKWCLQTMVDRIEHLAVSGQIDPLGFEFAQAVKRLNSRGRMFEELVPAADLSRLHRSDKAKSGFVGVYSNGKGFRAEGKDHKTGLLITIGTFPTAESAAHARYQHYQRAGMPYGRLEELMEQYRKREESLRAMSDERLKHEVIWSEAANSKRPIEGLSDEDRALERINPYTGERT